VTPTDAPARRVRPGALTTLELRGTVSGMRCSQHEIVARDRRVEVDPARFDHFELGPGGPIDDEVLLRDPTWTLYAMDPDHDRALMVQLPDDVDLAAQPFAFVAQFDRALRAAVVPMDRLVAMADDLARPATLVHLFSTGRCGSTLASRIFAELDGVWSVSEPDAIAQLVTRRGEYGTQRMQDMLRAASWWSYRPMVPRDGQTCVLKYRSEALFDAADYLRATPDSTALFLSRDLVGWVNSTYRFGQRHGVDISPGSTSMRDLIWPIISADAPAVTVADICDPCDPATPMEVALVALWTMRIEAYRDAVATGVAFHAFTYDQLNDDRAATVAALLAALGQDGPDNRARAMRAYEQDSQRGTAGARDRMARPLDDDQRARVAALARDNPRVRAAIDYLDAAG
jgi:hypothetical protein